MCGLAVSTDGAGDRTTPASSAHGFSGTREDGLAPFAERFAAAGLAALVFDYRGFGDSGGEPRQWLDVRRQRQDWAAAIAFVRGGRGTEFHGETLKSTTAATR